MIKIRFISNYYNHHQKPFCDVLFSMGIDFRFYSIGCLSKERLSLGYKLITEDYVFPYVDREDVNNDILSSDAVIFSYKPGDLFEQCLDKGILTFLYTERLFKRGRWRGLNPYYFFKCRHQYFGRKSLPYILCAGAYVKDDFSLLGFPSSRCLKFGYFPSHNDDVIIKDFYADLNLLWVGRFIDWKHPEIAINVSRLLLKKGISHHLDMIGNGLLYDKINRLVQKDSQLKSVSLLGSKSPEEVQEYMRKAHILLVTSDKQEGWGAVVNEGLSNGCIVIACEEEGSVPFLISDNINGFSYKRKSASYITSIIEDVIRDKTHMKQICYNAQQTIREMWNEKIAVERFLDFIVNHTLPISGPMSLA